MNREDIYEDYLEAIKGCAGNYSIVAQRLDITRIAARDYILKRPELVEMFKQEREKVLDMTENKLVEKINEGEFPAIKFMLLTQGKNRNYYYKNEQTIKGDMNNPLEIKNKIEIDENLKTELDRILGFTKPD